MRAWATVRGQPSRMKPRSLVSLSARRPETISMMRSSPRRSPRSMSSLAFLPSGVPCLTASRSMSPVETWVTT